MNFLSRQVASEGCVFFPAQKIPIYLINICLSCTLKKNFQIKINLFEKNQNNNLVQYRLIRCQCTINMHELHQRIMLMVIADYYYPDWGCLVDFFAIPGWKIAGMAGDLADNLRS